MFGRRIRLFNLLGFEVGVDWSWFIIALLVVWSLARGLFSNFVSGLPPGTYWWMAVAGAAGLFASIVLHEFGHSVVARACGIQMGGITLFVFGGVAQMNQEPPSPKSEFLMAIAGPITSFILAGVASGLRWLSNALAWPVEATAIFAYLSWINLALGVFNLVPAFPLDGGRILRSILWAARKNLLSATRIASGVGAGFAYLLLFGGALAFFFGNFMAGFWWFVLGLFIRAASRMSYQQVAIRGALAGQAVTRFMDPQPLAVPASTSLKDLAERYVYRSQFRTFPVVEDGQFLGCIHVDQLKQIPSSEWERRTAQSLAAPCSEATIAPETDAADALSTMRRTNRRRLLVVDQNHLLGVINLHDLLNFLVRKTELEGA